MAPVASFHLVRHRAARAAALALAADRFHLRRVRGLRFWRVLGTGRGRDTGPSVDPRRTALFAVWADEGDLDAFLARSPVSQRWEGAEEAWHVRLRAISGHGAWRGFDVLGAIERGSADGPIAIVTRADVRAGSWLPFGRAGGPVSAELQGAPGLQRVVGFGEAPIGRLGTFSLWRGADDVGAYSRSPRHADVVRRTRRERWYGEELFARFEPFASSGTWEGDDPLAGTGGPRPHP